MELGLNTVGSWVWFQKGVLRGICRIFYLPAWPFSSSPWRSWTDSEGRCRSSYRFHFSFQAGDPCIWRPSTCWEGRHTQLDLQVLESFFGCWPKLDFARTTSVFFGWGRRSKERIEGNIHLIFEVSVRVRHSAVDWFRLFTIIQSFFVRLRGQLRFQFLINDLLISPIPRFQGH